MAIGEDEHVKVQIITWLVSFIKFLCLVFCSRLVYVFVCRKFYSLKWLPWTSMSLVGLGVVYSTIYSQIRWKHDDLKRRREAFGMIQFVWVFGAYKTFEFLQITSSNSSCTLFSHMIVASTYCVLWSSPACSLPHMAVTVPLLVIHLQWLKVELQ